MEKERIVLLVFGAGVMPGLWGWTVHWLMSKLWPPNQKSPLRPKPPSPPPLDYQI